MSPTHTLLLNHHVIRTVCSFFPTLHFLRADSYSGPKITFNRLFIDPDEVLTGGYQCPFCVCRLVARIKNCLMSQSDDFFFISLQF